MQNKCKNSIRIKTKFAPIIELSKDKDCKMALVSLETYYTFPNIDSSNNNFRYSSDNGETWINTNIPEGSNEIFDINEYVQRIMFENSRVENSIKN